MAKSERQRRKEAFLARLWTVITDDVKDAIEGGVDVDEETIDDWSNTTMFLENSGPDLVSILEGELKSDEYEGTLKLVGQDRKKILDDLSTSCLSGVAKASIRRMLKA